jgi:membrane-anchored protein YejM (alkaline phosphatase superfamily)
MVLEKMLFQLQRLAELLVTAVACICTTLWFVRNKVFTMHREKVSTVLFLTLISNKFTELATDLCI